MSEAGAYSKMPHSLAMVSAVRSRSPAGNGLEAASTPGVSVHPFSSRTIFNRRIVFPYRARQRARRRQTSIPLGFARLFQGPRLSPGAMSAVERRRTFRRARQAGPSKDHFFARMRGSKTRRPARSAFGSRRNCDPT